MKSILRKFVVSIITWEARLVLARYKPKIVAVTGSVGKTSTKDAIYTVLSTKYVVRRSEKSFNSEIGVPLTILGLQNGWNNPLLWFENIFRGLSLIVFKTNYPEWLVLEVGADRPGDIKSITTWLKPDVAVITYIGEVPVHVEFFSSQKQLVEEKSYLARNLKQGGTLILNGQDPYVLAFKQYAKGGKVLVVHLNGEGDVVGSHDEILYEQNEVGDDAPVGMRFRVNFSGNSVPVTRKGALGLQHIFPTLYALAVGISQGLNIVPTSEALSTEVHTPGRMRLLAGIKKTYIIDDTYNSSPVALHEAIKTLRDIMVRGKKIAVLGDMLELGKHSAEEHKKAGHSVAKVADKLVVVGLRSRYIAEGALNNGMSEENIFEYEEAKEAGVFIQNLIQEGDLILIKGSQSMRMERIVEEIMAEPLRKDELLVRQDPEWLRK